MREPSNSTARTGGENRARRENSTKRSDIGGEEMRRQVMESRAAGGRNTRPDATLPERTASP
jgi:hypothetical protein